MALERTFSIIKPDATKRNLTGKINAKLSPKFWRAKVLLLKIVKLWGPLIRQMRRRVQSVQILRSL